MDSIPYSRVPHSTPLLLDYAEHYERVSRYYSGPPADIASFRRVAEAVDFPAERRRNIVDILERQNRGFGSSRETAANIDRLSRPGTFAAVTGQQVCLLGGPAFTLYKALSAICVAQTLTSQGLETVPVFWLATEDHDFDEVAEARVFDADYETVVLRDPGVRSGSQPSVGIITLSDEINATLARLESLLPASESQAEIIKELRAAYQPGATWGDAFGRWMAKVFGRWGVILLNPLDEEIHRLSAPLYERALNGSDHLRKTLLDRSEALVNSGYHAQVHVHEDSTLLFVSPDGNRTPILRGTKDGEFSLRDSQSVSLGELQKKLGKNPLEFSASALLRPLVQDSLLPTVAYIGGPAEVAYLGQAQAIYEIANRPMPVAVPRAGFTLLDQRVRRLLDRYQATVEDIWAGDDHITRKLASSALAPGWSERFDQSESELSVLLERLRRDIEQLDPTLADALTHAEEKMRFQLERLRGKLSRAAVARSELLSRHARMLQRFILPQGGLQERHVSGACFLAAAGVNLLDQLLAAIPFGVSGHGVVTY